MAVLCLGCGHAWPDTPAAARCMASGCTLHPSEPEGGAR